MTMTKMTGSLIRAIIPAWFEDTMQVQADVLLKA